MSDLSAAFILVAILHGGPDDPFSITQLALFVDEAKCEQGGERGEGRAQGRHEPARDRLPAALRFPGAEAALAPPASDSAGARAAV